MQQTINNIQQKQYKLRLNHQIRVPQVRVILADGTAGGIMDTKDALKLAQDQNLDLIEINPKSAPPVCRIAEYGKMLYEEKKKQAAAKKNQQAQEIKELNCRPNTDESDFQRLIEKAKQFLIDGNRVRFTIKFRGREISHQEIGKEKIKKIINELNNIANITSPILEGKNMSIILMAK